MLRLSKIKIMFMKDYDDIIKTKYIASSLLILPFFMIIGIPLLIMTPMLLDPGSIDTGDIEFLLQFTLTDDWSTLDLLQKSFVIFVEFTAIFLLLIPMILPTIISADSFAGEKDRGTVEGLIAAPISDAELYVGKIATSVVPTVLIIWMYSIPQVILINYFSNQILGYSYLPNLRYLMMVVLIVPLVTILMTNVMIWASTRTSSTRDAQQLGSLIGLPLMIIILNVSTSALLVSELLIFIGIIILSILTYFSYRIGVSLLDRERWLSYSG